MPDVREKLVELLRKVFPMIWYENCEENRHPMCDDIHCSECIADRLIANGVTIQRWIPVEERLPEDDGEYLAVGNHRVWWYAVLMFAKDGRKVDEYDFHEHWENVWYDFDRDCGHYIYGSVTHWMPLPQPPKGE